MVELQEGSNDLLAHGFMGRATSIRIKLVLQPPYNCLLLRKGVLLLLTSLSAYHSA